MTTTHHPRCRTNCEHAAAANAITIAKTADGRYAVERNGEVVYIWRWLDNAERHMERLVERVCRMHSKHTCDCADVAARRSWTIVRGDDGVPVRMEL